MSLKQMLLKVRFKKFKCLKVKIDKNTQAFFSLLRAGLWENIPAHGEGCMVHGSEEVDWEKVYQLAEEQSVIGVVLAGIEHSYVKPPQDLLLQWIGEVQIIEQQNKALNEFVAKLIEKMRHQDVYAILVKGQGIAQCYEKPHWRASGDVDLLLSESNYEKAKDVLIPLAMEVEKEYTSFKHLGLTIEGFQVELHGTMHSRLTRRMDCVIDEAQRDVFYGGNVRSWQNGKIQVFLPDVDDDIIFVFTHILRHFFFEGIGLRQICDWCRLLWTYRDSLNIGLLESWLKKAGVMSEWKAFAAFAVEYLGMPVEAMPFYSREKRWRHKGDKICSFILEVGNFGHKQRRQLGGMSYLKRKFISFWGRIGDMLRHFTLFPKDSIIFLEGVIITGFHAAVRGE